MTPLRCAAAALGAVAAVLLAASITSPVSLLWAPALVLAGLSLSLASRGARGARTAPQTGQDIAAEMYVTGDIDLEELEALLDEQMRKPRVQSGAGPMPLMRGVDYPVPFGGTPYRVVESDGVPYRVYYSGGRIIQIVRSD